MGGRGASSSRGGSKNGGGSGGGSSEDIAKELGFQFNSEDAANLPEDVKMEVASAIKDMVKEFPQLKDSVERIDFHHNRKGDDVTLASWQSAFGKGYITLYSAFKDKSTFDNVVKGNDNGPANGNNIKATVYHEMGHALVFNSIEKFKGRYKDPWKAFNKGRIANHIGRAGQKILDKQGITWESPKYYSNSISKYATTSPNEGVAEAISDYMTNRSKAQPLSRAIVAAIRSRS